MPEEFDRRRILVVDDEERMVRFIRMNLEHDGFQVAEAFNGKQAIQKLRDVTPDLILLDVMMPDMDGYEVTRRLRQHPATAETPILMFTAKTQLDDKVVGFEAGANDYLTKPTHPSELQARVKTLLARVGRKRGASSDDGSGNRGYVIGVLAARGGLGVTTLAVNLAAGLLNRAKSEVIVAELLPGQGALALDLGLTASKGLIDLLSLNRVADITRDKTREALTHHGSGLKLLLSSDHPRDMQLINQTAHYEATLSTLASLARFVVLDLGVGIQPFAHKILPYCNELLIVLESAPKIIAHTRALIDDIVSMNVNKRNINVVLNNRIRNDTQLPTTQVQSKLDFEIISTLSPAPELFTQATRLQAPAVLCQPESLTTRQVNKLVEFIAEREALPR